MESLIYVCLYLLKNDLPWKFKRKISSQLNDSDVVENTKWSVSVEELTENLPDCFRKSMEYIRNMEYKSTPDYGYLKNLFRKQYYSMGYSYDDAYDWSRNVKTSLK